MEQVPYWMWTKRKPNMMSSLHQAAPASTKIPISYNDSSWEEQAFAEDATGAFGGGGCIWPPRSYSCSFCRREFRSAQALGGHMNVHRRDRARLKQSSPTHHQDHHHQNHHLGFQYLPSHDPVCHLVYHQNPNSNEGSNNILSRVSGFSVVDDDNNYDQQIITNLENPNMSPPISSSPPSWANFVVGRYNKTLDLKKSDKPKVDHSLNLVLHATNSSDAEEEEANTRSCKKRRIIISSTDASTLPFKIQENHVSAEFQDSRITPFKIQEHHVVSAEFLDEQSSNSTILEDLDLELRLGDRPKYKEELNGYKMCGA